MTGTVQYSFRRVEKKYFLMPQQYQQMCAGMAAYMQADQHACYTIGNLYYDTENYTLIRTSLEKPVYKEKLRIRSYGVPGDRDKVFVELKKKYDGVVYKRRVLMEAAAAQRYLSHGIRPENEEQIHHEIDWFMHLYQPEPRVFIGYEREAYAGIELPDLRITFDTGLRWRIDHLDLRQGQAGTLLLPPDQILMEIKIPGAAPVWLARLLSELKVYPTSFSKYGTYYKQQILGQTAPQKIHLEVMTCA